MKALRVIKIIAFVLALLTVAVGIAGNVFVAKDYYIYKDKGITVAKILEDIDNAEFTLKFSRTAEAEEAATEAPEVTAEPTTEPTAEPTAEPTVAPTEPAATVKVREKYDINNYHPLLIDLQKAATKRIEIKCLKDMTLFNQKPFQSNGFTVNLCVLISFCLFTLAFIFHCISKNCSKTFYGIVLMILGYILFTIFVAAGQFAANAFDTFLKAFDKYDANLIRIYTVTGFCFLGVFFGLPYLRCGSRQMVMKEMKQTIRKLKRKYAH